MVLDPLAGLLENDGFRRALLARVAEQAGGAGFRRADTSFAAERAAQLDLLGDLVEPHLDAAAVARAHRSRRACGPRR